MKKIDNVDWEKAQKLKEQGLSYKEVGEQIGINKSTVWSKLSRIGIEKEDVDWGSAQALRDAGWHVKRIAKELRTSPKQVLWHTKEPAPRKKYEHEWNEHEPTLMRHNNLI